MTSIPAAFIAHAERTPDRVALRTMDGQVLTWSAWHADAMRVAGALQKQRVAAGDRVAILAGNSLVWPVADVGILLAGGVSVGLYPTSSAVQVADVLNDCGARVLIVEGEAQLAKVREIRAQVPALECVVSWHGATDGATAWTEWLTAAPASQVVPRAPHDDAVLIYTSGSTGVPKGARISHACLVATAKSVAETLELSSDDTSLSYLPFCHAAERMFGHGTRIWLGMEAMLVDDVAQVFDAAATYHPTLFGGLPRFYEKAYDAMRAAELAGPISDAAARVQAARERLFGTKLRVATSGGAALPPAVAEYLDAHGVRVLGAYGQTEHLCVAMHLPARFNFATVGLAMPGTVLRIAEDGEVLVERSALTFSGYWRRDDETREAFTADGQWLKTGDLGAVDAEGFLTITGRKKELIALSSGKKVAPLPIEAALCDGPWIEHAVLFGEGRHFVTAVVTLRESTVRTWAAQHDVLGSTEHLMRDPRVTAQVQAQVDAVNATVSRPEQVKRWALAPAPFTTESGELTPTMKVKRAAVTAKYGMLVDPFYA